LIGGRKPPPTSAGTIQTADARAVPMMLNAALSPAMSTRIPLTPSPQDTIGRGSSAEGAIGSIGWDWWRMSEGWFSFRPAPARPRTGPSLHGGVVPTPW
jgi:hypothetical protein